MVSVSSDLLSISVHPSNEEIASLTREERRHLESVRKKAAEFEEKERHKRRSSTIQGRLSKYTNVVMGWQHRWFVLTPETGMLEYYMTSIMNEVEKSKPRGGVHLGGALISPSDEDSRAFTISAACGEVYKLRANDVNERLVWVNELLSAAEFHASSPVRIPVRAMRSQHSRSPTHKEAFLNEQSPKSSDSVERNTPVEPRNREKKIPVVGLLPSEGIPTFSESLASIKICVDKAVSCQKDVARIVESFPLEGADVKCSDTDLLLLKATSQALVQSLEHCYLILLQRQIAMLNPKGLPSDNNTQLVDSSKP